MQNICFISSSINHQILFFTVNFVCILISTSFFLLELFSFYFSLSSSNIYFCLLYAKLSTLFISLKKYFTHLLYFHSSANVAVLFLKFNDVDLKFAFYNLVNKFLPEQHKLLLSLTLKMLSFEVFFPSILNEWFLLYLQY